MNLLRQQLAPISDKAWEEINETSKDVFSKLLTGRRFSGFDGPKGWDYAAYSTGNLLLPDKQKKNDIQWGIRMVLPLLEVRMPFKLDIWELDNINRGKEDINLDALETAARRLAEFEEKAIYYGFPDAGIKGLKETSEYDPIKSTSSADGILKAVGEAMLKLQDAYTSSPYYLVVNEATWLNINKLANGYPIKKQIENIIGGEIIRSKFIDESFLVSADKGNFNFISGVDISIGYTQSTTKEVELYFTESFTYNINDPASIVLIEHNKK